VDIEDVLADVVCAMGEGSEIRAVGRQEGCAGSGWAAAFYIVVHAASCCSVSSTEQASRCEVSADVNCGCWTVKPVSRYR
jgi:hypothetical protein